VTADGYFRTGDIGRITPDGALQITGRKKDLIIRGGENISAKEIEDVLHMHPDIREAAVVAMPHARLGEGVCAYVIGTASAVDLIAHVAASGLAKQKTPEYFEFVDEFPRTASGKIRKDQLRADIQAKLA
jgi:acyl-CoA synthetase (AMP-forming)/AMP-acid ligase II